MKHESETWPEYFVAALGRILLAFCGIPTVPKSGWLVGLIELAIGMSLFIGALMIIATHNSH